MDLNAPRFLLDTNHWSYLERGHSAVVARLEQALEDARFYMSVVVQGELLAGIEIAADPARRAALREWYQGTVRDVAEVLPITPDVAEEYARIFAALRKAGHPISSNDIWIAATAVARDLVLVTSDQDFQHIPGINIQDWTSE